MICLFFPTNRTKAAVRFQILTIETINTSVLSTIILLYGKVNVSNTISMAKSSRLHTSGIQYINVIEHQNVCARGIRYYLYRVIR